MVSPWHASCLGGLTRARGARETAPQKQSPRWQGCQQGPWLRRRRGESPAGSVVYVWVRG
jgi:hypothetical protein